MTHYKGYKIGFGVEVEPEVFHYAPGEIGFNETVGRQISISPRTDEGIGFSETIGAGFQFTVGISEGIGFSGESAETNFWFQGKYFGTLQNSYENGTQNGTPDLSDYWVSFIPNEGLYWDDNLDTSDLELIVVFRIDETAFSSLPTSHDVVFKSGDNSNGFAVSYLKRGDGQPYLYVTGESGGTVTRIGINIKNIDLDTSVWYEVFATSTKLLLREYDTPSNAFEVTGSITFGYTDYYESIGYSLGGSPVTGSTGGYALCSIRSIDYYHAGKIDMPTGADALPFYLYCRFGSNHEGNAGRVSENGTPTINTEWVTFDGNDAYQWGNNTLQQVDDIDIKITFRLEEAHLDTFKGKYTLWKVGDNTDGFEVLIVDREFIFCSRNNGTLKTSKVALDNFTLDIWYEGFFSTSKMTVREEATPANGFTQSATIDVNATPTANFYMSLGSDLGGYVYEGGSASWQDYTEMSCKELILYKKGGLTFPADLSAPVVGPIFRWNWGSSVGGTYSWSQGGSPTINTDNLESDGNDALYDNSGGAFDKPSTGWGLVIEFECDDFSSAAVLWKTGDEANGAAIGVDASGNFGFFGRSSSTLTSITIDSDDLSTATRYIVYATDSKVNVYDSSLSLVATSTGTVTASDSDGTNDQQGILAAVYGSPITGTTNTWNDYWDGRIYYHEIWEEDDLTFPPSNWYHAEDTIGFGDTVEGDMNTAIEEATSTIGFTEVTGAEKISTIVNTSEGIGFTDVINVLESETHFSEATIGFNETVTGEQRATKKEATSTIGFNEETDADHIDESTGYHEDSEIGFADTIDGYNTYRYKEALSTIGLNEEADAHIAIRNVGFTSTIGFDDTADGYNSFFHKEVTSTIGFDDTAEGGNVLTEAGMSSEIGLDDTIDGYNSFFHKNFSSTIGLNETVGTTIEQEEGSSEDIAFDDTVGEISVRNVGFSSQLGLNGESLGGNPLNPDNEGEIGFDETVGADYFPAKGFSATIGFSDESIPIRQYEKGLSSTLGFADSGVAENAGNLLVEIPANVTYKFYLTLTGANDSLSDYEIEKLKTIQFRMKTDGESSYLGITAMYSEAAETAIDARQNGTLVLEMASVYEGVEVLREDLMEVNFSDVRYDLGSSSQSISINGYSALTYDNDVVFLANAISKKTSQDGRVAYRFARPNFYLRPGYKVVYGLENFTADEVSFYVGENEFHMDVYFDSATLSGLNTNDIYQRYSLPTDRERKFFATLTGSQDSTDDYLFSGIIDIQVRLSYGKRSYASVKVLHSQEVQDAIAARPNGDILIQVIDGVGASLTEFLTVNFNEVSYDLLPLSRTATLVGYKTIAFTSGSTFTPTEVISKGVDGGGFANVTTNNPNLSVTPGYSIIYDGLDFIAGEVNFNFQKFSQQMSMKDTITVTVEKLSDTTLGLTGQAVSNTFYRDEHSESTLGLSDFPHVSFNGVENAYHDTCNVGFSVLTGAELN